MNELQIKQSRGKNVKLVIFGDSISKIKDPFFKARWDKSLAMNYSVVGTKVRRV